MAGPSPSSDAEASALIACLYDRATKSDSNPKPLVRHTLHHVPSTTDPGQRFAITSWKTVEFAYRKAESVGVGKDLPTLARGLFTVAHTLDDHDGSEPESSAHAAARQRILVRGYDKFFNVGEMPWTKQASIDRYSSPPYLLTFKENGCIIFISALSPTQLIVTSKHALESLENQEGDDVAGEEGEKRVSHAAKGEEWLGRHLAKVGKTKKDLATELWSRGETAVAELCDDSFEEHVLAYPPERSGLHLHGLNANRPHFSTRPMSDVNAFATQWGFIPTRYLTMNSMADVKEFTDRIGTTGEYEGEAIEGFVVRTTMPDAPAPADRVKGTVPPPYSPGQTWFYKVKFDEPYLMYRDWRELAKRMLVDRNKWLAERQRGIDREADDGKEPDELVKSASRLEIDDPSPVTADGAKKSKNQLKKEQKARQLQLQRSLGPASGAPTLPQAPKARSDRPETKLFVQWCWDRMYGSQDGRVRAQPALFEGLNVGKGIIRLRDTFLAYLETGEGRDRLAALGGAEGALAARLGQDVSTTSTPTSSTQPDTRPYTHLLLLPISLPGAGKTTLFHSLSSLYPRALSHTQSDDVPTKKSGPTFLRNICSELSRSRVVLADRNNHLLQHRDEVVEAVRTWEARGGRSEEQLREEKKKHFQKYGKKMGAPPFSEEVPLEQRPRVKFLTLLYELDVLPFNALHRLLSDRILGRGDNHQSLVADTSAAAGCRAHEVVLWRFLEAYEPFGSAEGKGEGTKGWGDVVLRQEGASVTLNVEASLREQLEQVWQCLTQRGVLPREGCEELEEAVRRTTPAMLDEAIERAKGYKATQIKSLLPAPGSTNSSVTGPRYYAISVEVDLARLLPPLLEAKSPQNREPQRAARLSRARALLTSLSASKRVVTRPHITLVHNSALRRDIGDDEESALQSLPEAERKAVQAARRKWQRYEALCGAGEAGVDFNVQFDRLCWEGDKVMTLSVSSVAPCLDSALSVEEMERLQGEGEEWRPHVTVGTRDAEVRPFEANRVVRVVDTLRKEGMRGGQEGEIEWIDLEGQMSVKGRLMGMSA